MALPIFFIKLRLCSYSEWQVALFSSSWSSLVTWAAIHLFMKNRSIGGAAIVYVWASSLLKQFASRALYFLTWVIFYCLYQSRPKHFICWKCSRGCYSSWLYLQWLQTGQNIYLLWIIPLLLGFPINQLYHHLSHVWFHPLFWEVLDYKAQPSFWYFTFWCCRSTQFALCTVFTSLDHIGPANGLYQ